MKKQNDLLKEAIADADAIKKLAVENAKASLNQAFDSKIKSMLAARLQEEAEEESDNKKKLHSEEMEENSDALNEDSTKNDDDEQNANEGPMDEIDINKILAEMEDDDENDDENDDKDDDDEEPKMKEYKEKGRHGDHEMEEGSGYYEAKDDNEEDENYDYMEESGKKGSDPENEKEKEDEDVNLEELLRELDEQSGDKDEEDEDDEDNEESSKHMKKESNRSHGGDEFRYSKRAKHDDDDEKSPVKESQWREKAEAYRSELNETRKLAATLTKKVNETNLINAKLLYLNKILNKHNLNESQKVRVISAFDRANSVKEAKIVFESLNEAFVVKTQKTKTNLKESLGFASKAAGNSTKRDIITEADDQVARWQKLAGINKK